MGGQQGSRPGQHGDHELRAVIRDQPKLDFLKPFEAHNRVDFALQAKGEFTEVTWTMAGDTPYFAKIIHVFIDMDRMVGKDFETGLANLKSIAEK